LAGAQLLPPSFDLLIPRPLCQQSRVVHHERMRLIDSRSQELWSGATSALYHCSSRYPRLFGIQSQMRRKRGREGGKGGGKGDTWLEQERPPPSPPHCLLLSSKPTTTTSLPFSLLTILTDNHTFAPVSRTGDPCPLVAKRSTDRSTCSPNILRGCGWKGYNGNASNSQYCHTTSTTGHGFSPHNHYQ